MFIHFNNAYWVMGGFTPEPQSDIWRSADGSESAQQRLHGRIAFASMRCEPASLNLYTAAGFHAFIHAA